MPRYEIVKIVSVVSCIIIDADDENAAREYVQENDIGTSSIEEDITITRIE